MEGQNQNKIISKTGKILRGRPFPPGVSGNPHGRPKGRKNFETYFREAWKEVAEALNLNKNPDKAKIEIIKLGFKRMFKGDYQFWRDFMDRLFGKAPEQLEVIQKQLLIDLTEPAKEKFKKENEEGEKDKEEKIIEI